MNQLGRQVAIAGTGLAVGAGLLPGLIYIAGISLLGPYEGASLPHSYRSILGGLAHGSVACWIVVLGPYLLFLLFRGLGAWWRAGT